jgi:hypothetical protein
LTLCPHEAQDKKCPAEVYQPSPRPYTGLPDVDHPLRDKTIVVPRLWPHLARQEKINFSTVFAGQAVGIQEVYDDIWLVEWRAQGEDFRTFLAEFVAASRQLELLSLVTTPCCECYLA